MARELGPSNLEGVIFAIFFWTLKFASVSSFQQLFKMVEQGSLIVGKRLVYSDLDIANLEDLVDTPLEFPMESHIQSRPSSIQGKKKKMFAHEKNLDYPSKAYGHFVRKVALNYYKRCSLDSLKTQFLD